MDGIGAQFTDASELDAYFDLGCLVNQSGRDGVTSPPSAINQHAIYDAARRWSWCIRMIPRTQLVGYAVEGGKSVLWFTREAAAGGAAPGRVEVASGDIEPAAIYEVEGTTPGIDFVDYDGITWQPGERFTGGGSDDFTAYGDATVWRLIPGQMYTPAGQDYWDGIADRIAAVAPPQGWSNRWVMGFQFRAYHPSESSLWKPGAYSDYFPFTNRCHFGSPEIGADPSWLWHTSYGLKASGVPLSPESPSGYNYGRLDETYFGRTHVNEIRSGDAGYPDAATRQRYYKSCRLYEPDIEVESAVTVEEDGSSLVKVTMVGRLHNTSGETGGAPSSISRDMSGWVGATIAAEPFRTAENALRLYLLHASTGANFDPTYGDQAAHSPIPTWADNPYASIYPLVLLTRLVPEPHPDANTRQDKHDTPIYHDVLFLTETYLRAMCEGFVDPDSTFYRNECHVEGEGIPATCTFQDFGIYDYTFESLCLAAFGGRWFGCMASEETEYTEESQTRPDKPRGHGPPPNTRVTAELVNQMAEAVDRLNHVRLMLPWQIARNYSLYVGAGTNVPRESGMADCGADDCGASGQIVISGVAQPATTLVSATGDDGVIWAYTRMGFDDGCHASGGWSFSADRRVQTYEFSPVDPDIVYAFPPEWRDMVETGAGVATLCCLTTGISYQREAEVNTSCFEGSACKFEQVNDYATSCVFATRGTLDHGEHAPTGLSFMIRAGWVTECRAGAGRNTWLVPLTNLDMVLVVPVVDYDPPA